MISLKAYIREIENLIDQGLYQEAITHCKHILSKYPKYVDVYRNLGKALLELKRYKESEDIFFRVLSVYPDDFISHAGLSIIAEEQNNLDLAIWHMELAFDVQPSNLAIQDELKRLFRLRDGNSPIKIRLTHGALIRMYARGELYQQAISETKAILIEDPKRIDLEILLAKMLFLSGDQNVAEKKSLEIISKIPFCFEVNQLLENLFNQRNDSEGAEVFRNRLISIDPYYQFVQYPYLELDVPEQKLVIDKVELNDVPNFDQSINHSKMPFDFQDKNSDWLEPIDNSIFEEFLPATQKFEKIEYDSTGSDSSMDDVSQSKPIVEKIISLKDEEPDKKIESSSNIQKKNISKNDFHDELPQHDLKNFFSELSEERMKTESDDFINNGDDNSSSADFLSQFSNSEINEEEENIVETHEEIPEWLHSLKPNSITPEEENGDMPSWLKNLQSEVAPDSTLKNEDFVDQPSISPSDDNNTDSSESVFQPDPSSNGENDFQSIRSGWEKIDLQESEQEILDVSAIMDASQEDLAPDDNRIPDWVNSVLLSDSNNDQKIDAPFSHSDTFNDQIIASKSDSQRELQDNESIESDHGLISNQTNDELLDWLRGLKTVEANSEDNQATPENDNPVGITESEEIKRSPTDEIENSDAVLNDLALKILENQKLSNKTNHDSNSNQMPEIDQTLEKELEMLFSPPKNDVNASTGEEKNNALTTSPHLEGNSPNNVQSSMYGNDENQVQNDEILSEFEILLNNKNYAKISERVLELFDNGYEYDFLLECIRPQFQDTQTDFGYWQMLGDVLCKDNRFIDALSAYQKAEDLLKNNMK